MDYAKYPSPFRSECRYTHKKSLKNAVTIKNSNSKVKYLI